MNDMSGTIIAKSDQMNAADMVGISFIGAIREVRIKADKGDDQPVDILFEGQKKAFRPCKGVRRLLVKAWGPDANNYIGKTLELFCDPSVTWAGKEEGGIRVSRMSHIERAFTFAMRISRAATKPYKIEPLVVAKPRQQNNEEARAKAQDWTDAHLSAIDDAMAEEDLDLIIKGGAAAVAKLKAGHPDLHDEVTRAYEVRRAALTRTGPDDSQHGDQFTDADETD